MATPTLSELSPRQQSATVTLAQQAARRSVKHQLQRQGRVKPSMLAAAELTRLAEAYLATHRELYAQAAQSPIVQMLGVAHRKRRPRNQSLPLCETQVQNDAGPAGDERGAR
jgi:hypothetical protein